MLTVLLTAAIAWGIGFGQDGLASAWQRARPHAPQWLTPWVDGVVGPAAPADGAGAIEDAEAPTTNRGATTDSSATSTTPLPPPIDGGEPPEASLMSARIEVRAEGDPVAVLVNGADLGARTPTVITLQGRTGDHFVLTARDEAGERATLALDLGPTMPTSWDVPVRGGSQTAEVMPPATASEPKAADVRARTLRVTSRPAGATVYLDATRLPRPTPVEISIVDAERHQIRVELPGYRAAGWSFRLDDLTEAQRGSGELFFPLANAAADTGTVRATAPGYEATLLIAGQRFTVRDTQELSVPAGTHAIEIDAPEVFLSGTRSLLVNAGATVELQLPRAFSVTISASPGNCRVTLDGRFLDVTPVQARIVGGEHALEFFWPGLGRTIQRTERISQEGQRIFVTADVAPVPGPAEGPAGEYEPPVKIHHVDPEYPAEARRQRIEGSVLLTLTIDEAGNVVRVRVARGLGAGLDESAVRAAMQWKYQPARAGGRPLTTTLVEAIRFQLR